MKNKLKSLFANSNNKLGTFGGVFTPDVLTILGVIMYLRLGWVVGNAGLLGAIAIILLAKSITIATSLAMSSITTNIKIGAGGAYSIISKSLGLETGGSIGIPFYISQTLSTSLYIAGFTEGWLAIFPSHSSEIVIVAAWLALLGIAYISTAFAIKVQYIIMVIIGLSIISFMLSPSDSTSTQQLLGNFEDANFWQVFAIFFPAVTGIMAGANLSGDLREPRKAIPIGTLSAIGVTLIIYVSLAYGFYQFAGPTELRSNQMIMAEKALWGPLVLIGILAATFSSALGSIIGAPRILQALAQQQTIPFSNFFAVKSKNNEPRNAMLFTGAIVIITLFIGDFNSLAALITMFFLITYGTLNLIVFIQQSINIISFRPTFKVPKFVSLYGAIGCLCIMFLINPVFSVVAMTTIVALYVWLTRKGLKSNWGDIRGGMFLALAERASRIAAKFPRHHVAWKPDMLIPIEEPKLWAGPLLFIRNILYPSGSLFAFSVKNEDVEDTEKAITQLLEPLDKEGILVNSTVLEDQNFLHGTKLVVQTLKGGTFRPNTLFLTLGNNEQKDSNIISLVDLSTRFGLGVLILRQHSRMAFGMQKDINLWLRDKSPNWHLAMLIALQLQLNWEGKINLVTVAQTPAEETRLFKFLNRLSDRTRLPSLTEFHVLHGSFSEVLNKAPRADVNIFGLSDELNFSFMRDTPENINSSCLFVKDSGQENALA